MEDKRKNNGGARENSGRFKKDELFKLLETMDAICIPYDVFLKLYERVESGDLKAIEIWLKYRLGMPKQMIDVQSGGKPLSNKPNVIILPANGQ